MRKILALSACSLILLAGCNKNQQPVAYVPAQQPTVVVQQPSYQQQGYVQGQPVYVQPPVVVQQSNGATDVVTGMAVGAMLGHALSSGPSYQPSYNRSTTIVNHTTVIHQASRPSVPVAVPTPSRSYTVPARPMMSASRPSFSSSSSFRSSSSSFRSSSFGSFSRRK